MLEFAKSSAASEPALRVAVAQINLLVGDIDGNAERVVAEARKTREELGADVLVFPELTLTGYPPEDLLLRPGLYPRIDKALSRVCSEVRGIDLVIGYPHRTDQGIYNACALIRSGQIVAHYFKQELPNYGVFDEKRYFLAGSEPCIVNIRDTRVALTICEDVWVSGPTLQASQHHAQLMLNINASPYHTKKGDERADLLAERAREGRMPIVYANLVGGQDELVFDGNSFVVAADGQLVQRAPSFEESVFVVGFDVNSVAHPLSGPVAPNLSFEEDVYRALVMGVRDYVEKNRFAGVVIGLSGGVDSALTLTIAVDALGPERVDALLMPSRYTADMSIEDARTEAESLGVRHYTISIEEPFRAFLDCLGDIFAGTEPDTTEENIQARCRGLLLMALSNKRRKIVLATGNKSEMAVGYATLYGDMAGGFAPLKDVAKTDVYRLAKWRNGQSAVIPRRVLDRPPSAELAPNQVDEDTLPPYSILDAILECYVEKDLSVQDIAALGYDPDTVGKVATMVLRNEYKRRQAAPGVRITRRAFGRDRRYPITSGYDV